VSGVARERNGRIGQLKSKRHEAKPRADAVVTSSARTPPKIAERAVGAVWIDPVGRTRQARQRFAGHSVGTARQRRLLPSDQVERLAVVMPRQKKQKNPALVAVAARPATDNKGETYAYEMDRMVVGGDAGICHRL
jgi:hypothetical protein